MSKADIMRWVGDLIGVETEVLSARERDGANNPAREAA